MAGWTKPHGHPAASTTKDGPSTQLELPVEAPVPVVPASTPDDPETPFHDARDGKGRFTKED